MPLFRGTEYPDSITVNTAVDPGRVVVPVGDGSAAYAPGVGEGAGISLSRVLSGGQTISILRRGEMDLGSAIQTLPEGSSLYADESGVLTDEDGAGANTRVGTVIPVEGGPAGSVNTNGRRNLLRLEL